jgi:hypothetical protein
MRCAKLGAAIAAISASAMSIVLMSIVFMGYSIVIERARFYPRSLQLREENAASGERLPEFQMALLREFQEPSQGAAARTTNVAVQTLRGHESACSSVGRDQE